MWYYHNLMEDKEEDFISHRDLVEYNASFIEPEAVRKIREAREESVEIPHDEFVAGLAYMFGREAPITREKKKGVETHKVDPKEAMFRANSLNKVLDRNSVQNNKATDYRYWLDLNLE